MNAEAGDRIEIRGLRLLGHHGALPGEQDAAQPFLLDLRVESDLAPAGRSDDLADALDYGRLVAVASAIVEGRRFALLEAIAESVADALLAEPAVRSATVAVRKLRPPLEADLADVGVRITRRRGAHR